MKGRARRKAAKFFVFENQADWSSGKTKKISLTSAQQAEIRVHDFIDSREPPLSEAFVFDTRLSHTRRVTIDEEIRAVENGEYKTSHGVVDLRSGKSLLNKYVLKMPLDASARASRETFLLHVPTFEEFQLILPSHLPVDVRIVELPEVYRASTQKGERQQIMALMACVRLHKLNLLNERLLPLTRGDLCEKLMTMSRNEVPPILKSTITVHSIFASGEKEIFAYPIVQFGIKASAWRNSLKGNSCSLALLSTETMKQIPMETYHHPELGEIIIQFGCERKETLTREQWDLSANFSAALLSSRWGKKSKEDFFRPRSVSDEQELLSPYTLGLVNVGGELDWEHMTKINSDNLRNDEQLLAACQLYSTTEALDQPRLCGTVYNQYITYIVHGPAGLDCGAPFPDALDGVETFLDYYKQKWDVEVSIETPLFLAQRLWYLPVKPLGSGSAQPTAFSYESGDHSFPECSPGKTKGVLYGLNSVLLPQTFCVEKHLGDASLSLLTVMLPQFLYHVDRHLISQAFVRHSTTNLPRLGAYLETLTIAEITKALTPKRAGLGESYDQLEWLGDAVLKLLQTDALLHTPELRLWVRGLHEGDLTTLRSAMSNNKFLCQACKRTGIDRFILATPLARGKWIPVNLELHSLSRSAIGLPYEATPSMKVCADVIEALLGMVYLKFGYAAAMNVAQEVGVSLPVDKLTGNQKKVEVKPCRLLLELVTKLTGKRMFDNPALVEEALTHPSAIYQHVPSYQKLEWIGDAVLCMAVREWIYKTYPIAEVGDMVTIEAAVVSNEILAYQSVKTGLHRFIRHRDQSLPSRLEYYEWSIGELSRGVWGTDPSKILSDVVESVFGAVHVDGGFAEGQTAVLTLMAPILAAVQEINGNAKMLSHPKTALNELGGKFLGVNVAREDAFVRSRVGSSSLWQGNRWRKAQLEGVEAVGTVCSMGVDLLSVSEPTMKAARNRACALVVAVLEANPSLSERLREVSRIVQGGHPTEVDDNESGLALETNASDEIDS
jgi:dsRNA-specific ribonuclease